MSCNQFTCDKPIKLTPVAELPRFNDYPEMAKWHYSLPLEYENGVSFFP